MRLLVLFILIAAIDAQRRAPSNPEETDTLPQSVSRGRGRARFTLEPEVVEEIEQETSTKPQKKIDPPRRTEVHRKAPRPPQSTRKPYEVEEVIDDVPSEATFRKPFKPRVITETRFEALNAPKKTLFEPVIESTPETPKAQPFDIPSEQPVVQTNELTTDKFVEVKSTTESIDIPRLESESKRKQLENVAPIPKAPETRRVPGVRSRAKVTTEEPTQSPTRTRVRMRATKKPEVDENPTSSAPKSNFRVGRRRPQKSSEEPPRARTERKVDHDEITAETSKDTISRRVPEVQDTTNDRHKNFRRTSSKSNTEPSTTKAPGRSRSRSLPLVDAQKLEVLPLFEAEAKTVPPSRGLPRRVVSKRRSRLAEDFVPSAATPNEVRRALREESSTATSVTVSRRQSDSTLRKRSSNVKESVQAEISEVISSRKIGRVRKVNELPYKRGGMRNNTVKIDEPKVTVSEVVTYSKTSRTNRPKDATRLTNSQEDISESDNYPEPFKVLLQTKKGQPKGSRPRNLNEASVTKSTEKVVTSSTTAAPSTDKTVVEPVSHKQEEVENEVLPHGSTTLRPNRPTRRRFSLTTKYPVAEPPVGATKRTFVPRKFTKSTTEPPKSEETTPHRFHAKFKFRESENAVTPGGVRKSGSRSFSPKPPTGLYSSRKIPRSTIKPEISENVEKLKLSFPSQLPATATGKSSRFSARYRGDLLARGGALRTTTGVPAYLPTVPTVTPQPVKGHETHENEVDIISFEDPVNVVHSANLVKGDPPTPSQPTDPSILVLKEDRTLSIKEASASLTKSTEKTMTLIEQIINSISAISTTDVPDSVTKTSTFAQPTKGSAIFKISRPPKSPNSPDETVKHKRNDLVTTEKPTTVIERILSSLSAIKVDKATDNQVGGNLNTIHTSPKSAQFSSTSKMVRSTQPLSSSTTPSTLSPVNILDYLSSEQNLQKRALGQLLSLLNSIDPSTETTTTKVVLVTPKITSFVSSQASTVQNNAPNSNIKSTTQTMLFTSPLKINLPTTTPMIFTSPAPASERAQEIISTISKMMATTTNEPSTVSTNSETTPGVTLPQTTSFPYPQTVTPAVIMTTARPIVSLVPLPLASPTTNRSTTPTSSLLGVRYTSTPIPIGDDVIDAEITAGVSKRLQELLRVISQLVAPAILPFDESSNPSSTVRMPAPFSTPATGTTLTTTNSVPSQETLTATLSNEISSPNPLSLSSVVTTQTTPTTTNLMTTIVSTTVSTDSSTSTPTTLGPETTTTMVMSTLPNLAKFEVSPGSVTVFSANDISSTTDDSFSTTVSINGMASTVISTTPTVTDSNMDSATTMPTTQEITTISGGANTEPLPLSLSTLPTNTESNNTPTEMPVTIETVFTSNPSGDTVTEMIGITTSLPVSVSTPNMDSSTVMQSAQSSTAEATTQDISSNTSSTTDSPQVNQTDASNSTNLSVNNVTDNNSSVPLATRTGKFIDFAVDQNVIQGSTMPREKDYLIFAVLPNNTILRKRPSIHPTKDTPFLVIGVYPNNTVIRKFPNGTYVPEEPIIQVDGFDTRDSPPPPPEITSNQVTPELDNRLDNNLKATADVTQNTISPLDANQLSLDTDNTTAQAPTPLPTLSEILGGKTVEAFNNIVNQTKEPVNVQTLEIDLKTQSGGTQSRQINISMIASRIGASTLPPPTMVTTNTPIISTMMTTVTPSEATTVPPTTTPSAVTETILPLTSTAFPSTTFFPTFLTTLFSTLPPRFTTLPPTVRTTVPTTTVPTTTSTTKTTTVQTTVPTVPPLTTSTMPPTTTEFSTSPFVVTAQTTQLPTTSEIVPTSTVNLGSRNAATDLTTISPLLAMLNGLLSSTPLPLSVSSQSSVSSSTVAIQTNLQNLNLKQRKLTEEQRQTLDTIAALEKEQAQLLQQLSFLTRLNLVAPKPKAQGNLANRVVSVAVQKSTGGASPPAETLTVSNSRETKNIDNTIPEDLLKQLNDLTRTIPPDSTTLGKSSDALLASILREQGIGPTTPQSLGDQIRLAGIFEQTTKPRSTVRTTRKPTTTPRPGRLMQGLNWLLNAIAPTPAPKKTQPKIKDEEEILLREPTHITPVIDKTFVTSPPRDATLTPEDLSFLIKQLESIEKNARNGKQLDLSSLQKLAGPKANLNVASSEKVQIVTPSDLGSQRAPISSGRFERTTPSSPVSVSNDIEEPTTRRRITLPPVQLNPVPGVGERDPQIRGNLVNAAINVTRAISSFLGSAIQDAAQQLSTVVAQGSGNIRNYFSSSSLPAISNASSPTSG